MVPCLNLSVGILSLIGDFKIETMSRYNKLAEMSNNKMHMPNGESKEEDNLPEDTVLQFMALMLYN